MADFRRAYPGNYGGSGEKDCDRILGGLLLLDGYWVLGGSKEKRCDLKRNLPQVEEAAREPSRLGWPCGDGGKANRRFFLKTTNDRRGH